MIDSRKLTKSFLHNYRNIVHLRLDEYPPQAKELFEESLNFNRPKLAEVVLKSEYRSLLSCLDTAKTFRTEKGKYVFIEDEDLIRNIIEHDFNEDILDDDGINGSNFTQDKKRKLFLSNNRSNNCSQCIWFFFFFQNSKHFISTDIYKKNTNSTNRKTT